MRCMSLKYSKRQGTRAAVMEDQVSEQVKARRSDVLWSWKRPCRVSTGSALQAAGYRSCLRRQLRLGGKWYMMGHTPQYVKAALPLEDGMNQGRVSVGRIMELFASGLLER